MVVAYGLGLTVSVNFSDPWSYTPPGSLRLWDYKALEVLHVQYEKLVRCGICGLGWRVSWGFLPCLYCGRWDVGGACAPNTQWSNEWFVWFSHTDDLIPTVEVLRGE